MELNFQAKIDTLKSLIHSSRNIVAFTGAGISTASGIPDFRSPGTGLWEKIDPMEIISLSSFRKDPERFYEWFHPLACDMVKAKPNIAHQIIANLQFNGKIKTIITQNIDLLHQNAGSRDVITLHGSTGTFSCLTCQTQNIIDDIKIENFIKNKKIPTCEHCGNYLKPNFVFFEEMLPHWQWRKANDAAFQADLFIVIGSSLEVYPANQIPSFAVQNGAKLVINTISQTPMDHIANLLLPFEITKVWNELSEIY